MCLGSKRQAPPPPLSPSISLKPPHRPQSSLGSPSLHPRTTGHSLSFPWFDEFVSPRGFLLTPGWAELLMPSLGPSCGQRRLCRLCRPTPQTPGVVPHTPHRPSGLTKGCFSPSHRAASCLCQSHRVQASSLLKCGSAEARPGPQFPGVFNEWVPEDEARAEPMHVHTSMHRHTHTLSHMPRSPAPSLPERLGLAWPILREPGYPWVTKGTTSVHWTTGVKATPGIPSRELGDLAAVTTPQGMCFSREVNGSGLPSAAHLGSQC